MPPGKKIAKVNFNEEVSYRVSEESKRPEFLIQEWDTEGSLLYHGGAAGMTTPSSNEKYRTEVRLLHKRAREGYDNPFEHNMRRFTKVPKTEANEDIATASCSNATGSLPVQDTANGNRGLANDYAQLPSRFNEVQLSQVQVCERDGPVVCSVLGCPHIISLDNPSGARSHFRAHYQGVDTHDGVKCIFCREIFDNIESLVRHTEIVHWAWRYKCPSPGCIAPARTRATGLKNHLNDLCGYNGHMTGTPPY